MRIFLSKVSSRVLNLGCSWIALANHIEADLYMQSATGLTAAFRAWQRSVHKILRDRNIVARSLARLKKSSQASMEYVEESCQSCGNLSL